MPKRKQENKKTVTDNKSNKKKLSMSQVLQNIIKIKREQPVPTKIMDVEPMLAHYNNLGVRFKELEEGEDFISVYQDRSFCSFEKENDDRFNIAEEGQRVEISDNYKSFMLKAVAQDNLKVVTQILSIDSRYAETATYQNHLGGPIHIASLAFNIPMTLLCLEFGATLLDETATNVALARMIGNYACDKRCEEYKGANELLCAIQKRGYLKKEDFVTNSEVYIQLEQCVEEYQQSQKIQTNNQVSRN